MGVDVDYEAWMLIIALLHALPINRRLIERTHSRLGAKLLGIRVNLTPKTGF